jgi:hypothetical protein
MADFIIIIGFETLGYTSYVGCTNGVLVSVV